MLLKKVKLVTNIELMEYDDDDDVEVMLLVE